jgi:hypothetical protein
MRLLNDATQRQGAAGGSKEAVGGSKAAERLQGGGSELLAGGAAAGGQEAVLEAGRVLQGSPALLSVLRLSYENGALTGL